MRHSIFRGRFQPFSKLHYDCIKAFYQENAVSGNLQDWPWLVLCIVRDYETVLSAHGLLRRHTSTGEYLRHLSFFNPFPVAYCKYYIREGMQHFLEADPVFKSDASKEQYINFRQFIGHKLIIQAVPLKFGEVLESLEHNPPKFTPDSIIRLIEEEGADPQTSESVNKLLSLFSIIVHETLSLPGPDKFDWFLPVLDKEDVRDYNNIRARYLPDRVLMRWHSDISTYYVQQRIDAYFSPELQDFRDIGPLSHYGVFIYYAYLTLAGKNFINSEDFTKEMQRVTEFIRPLISPNCFKCYQEEINKVKASTQSNYLDLTEEEKELLKNPHKFVELSQAYLRIPGLDDLMRLQQEGRQLGIRLTLGQCCDPYKLDETIKNFEKWKALGREANNPNNRFLLGETLLRNIKELRNNQPNKEVTVEFQSALDHLLSITIPADVDEDVVKKLESLLP